MPKYRIGTLLQWKPNLTKLEEFAIILSSRVVPKNEMVAIDNDTYEYLLCWTSKNKHLYYLEDEIKDMFNVL